MSAKSKWIDDSDIEECMNCKESFSVVVRKHHCRKCGGLFCDTCRNFIIFPPNDQLTTSNAFLSREEYLSQPQRCCEKCASQILKDQPNLRNILSKANKELIFERDNKRRYLNSPLAFQLHDEIRKAAYTLLNFTSDNIFEGSDRIPRELLWNAKGIAFLTTVKLGFFLTGRMGTGLVIRRLDDGSWSAPSAIAMSGAGWGFQIGGEVTDLMIILNTDKAVDIFAARAQVSLGTELSVSIGPLGRSAGTDLFAGEQGVSPAFSYAHSKGLFFGVSLEAAVIASRPSVNRSFYGEEVSPQVLLQGKYPKPKAADPLYHALAEVLLSDQLRNYNNLSNINALSLSQYFASRSSDEWSKERLYRLLKGEQDNTNNNGCGGTGSGNGAAKGSIRHCSELQEFKSSSNGRYSDNYIAMNNIDNNLENSLISVTLDNTSPEEKSQIWNDRYEEIRF